MMKHSKHLYLMVGLATLAIVLYTTGIGDGSLVLSLWVGGCAAMMFFMMRGIGGGRHGGDWLDGHRDESSPTPHDPGRHG